MENETFRNAIREKMIPIGTEYIDSIIYFHDYEKSNIHWNLIDLLCSYVKGTTHDPDKDIRLNILLRKESRKVTDHLDEKIGFSYDTGFRARPKRDIEILGETLVYELCNIALARFPDEAALKAFQDKEIKPHKLKIPSPVRGLTL